MLLLLSFGSNLSFKACLSHARLVDASPTGEHYVVAETRQVCHACLEGLGEQKGDHTFILDLKGFLQFFFTFSNNDLNI